MAHGIKNNNTGENMMWKILIIDDKEDNRISLSALLKKLIPECDVLVAGSGAEGLARAGKKLPDTILLDIHMPQMDGFEVCARLKADERTQNIPVIMLTAVKTDPRDLVKGLETGADAYLSKPIDENVMAAQVKTALRIRKAEEQLRWHNERLDRLVQEKTSSLQASEQRFRALLNAADDSAILVDSDFTVQAINDSGARRLGKSPEAIHQQNILNLFPPEIARKRKAMAEEVIRSGLPVSFEDERDEYIFFNRFYPIFDSEQQVVQLAWFAKDITRERKAEAEKKKLEEQLLTSQKMEAIGNLAGGIAHDFNNILSSVLGFAELSLDETKPGSTLEDNLREILTAGNRAKELIRQILTFARQADDTIKPLQISSITKESLKLLRSSLPSTIEIQQEIKSDSLIMGDPTQIHQIIMNLCTNAAQAMEKNAGVLKVSLQDVWLDESFTRLYPTLSPGNYQRLSVSDTGCGIAPEVIDSIFDPYFTTKSAGEGTGMGLSTVHGIVTRYGGVVTVDSRVGAGSTFTAYFPITKKRDMAPADRPETAPSGHENILLVDDEMAIVKMTGQMLEHLGYTVTSRTSSVEALALFRARPDDFDLVITDMTMPNMTGDVLAKEMMRIRPEIPVILCTGYSNKISDDTAAAAGIKSLIYKPIIKTDLARTIRSVLDGKRTK